MLGALSVRFVGWADWVDCRGFLFFVFLGVARRLELSPCNTSQQCLQQSMHVCILTCHPSNCSSCDSGKQCLQANLHSTACITVCLCMLSHSCIMESSSSVTASECSALLPVNGMTPYCLRKAQSLLTEWLDYLTRSLYAVKWSIPPT